jgi:hypothetical protein
MILTERDGTVFSIHQQENINGYSAQLEKDGTLYDILIIPFKGSLGCGYISNSNAYLVIDGLEKTAYAFTGNTHYTYVQEKLIRDREFGRKDAENTTSLINRSIEYIKAIEAEEAKRKETKWYNEKRELVK